jgi:pimeloyl-ACP methyl ester carboxylesterase
LNKKARLAQKYLLDDGLIQKPEALSWRDAGIIYHQDFLTAALSGSWFYVLNNSFYNEIETTSFTGELHKIEIPTLLLWGKYDFIVPPALGYSAFDCISSPDKKLVVFDKSGHSPMHNQADEFAEVVISFIERHQ